MPDLDERFRSLARTRTPDLWQEIERREPRPIRKPSSGRRLLAAAVAFAVAIAGIAFAVHAFGNRASRPAGSLGNGLIAIQLIRFPEEPGAGVVQDIYVMNADGTGVTNLTPDDADYFNPAWSPDGQRIAFVRFERNGEGFDEGIYVMNADGSGMTKVFSTGLPMPITVWELAWSPDATRIGFIQNEWPTGPEPQSEADAVVRLFVMDADGTGVTPLTEDGQVISFSWSPDGSKIVFTRQEPADENRVADDLFVMNVDGSGITRLTDNGWSRDPAWSPDGTRIAFSSYPPGTNRLQEDIFVVSSDGTGLSQLTGGPDRDGGATWSPDGTKLLFSRVGAERDCRLMVMEADGTGLQTLIGDDRLDGCPSQPAWQPVPAVGGPTPTPTEATTPAPPLIPRVTDVIDLGGPGSAVTYGEGSVWVAVSNNDGSYGGSVLRLDPATGTSIADIAVPAVPTWEVGGGGLAVGYGSVWVIGAVETPDDLDGRDWGNALLTRIDASTNRVVAEIDLGGLRGADVAVDRNGVWALIFTEVDRIEVVRVDPATDQVVARIPIDSAFGHFIFARGGPVVVSANGAPPGRGDLTSGGKVLFAIDPDANRVVGSLPLGDSAWPAMADDGTLWVVTVDRLLTVDPASLDVYADVPLRATGDALAVGNGGVWFLDPEDRGAVHRFNTTTNQVDVFVDLSEEASTPIVLATSPETVWVLDYDHKLVRIGLT